MNIYCIGDSLTEGDYGIFNQKGIANVHKENYPFYLSLLTKANVVNLGHCGFRSTTYYDECCEKQKIDISDADYILIMLGTNGGMEPDKNTQDNIAYEKIINYCKDNALNAKIILLTPPFATQNTDYSNCGYYNQICNAAKTVKIIADKYLLPIIDVFNYAEFCEENVSVYQANDGLHFIDKGYKELAKFIYQSLCELYPKDFC